MSLDWYPFFVVDYRRDTYHLTLAEDGAYRRLIDEYMTSREPLPNDDGALARILGIGKTEWESLAPRVRKFFRAKNDRLFHKRCDEELRAQEHRSARNSERGKKGASARYSKNKELDASSKHTLRTSCSVPPSPDDKPQDLEDENVSARARDDWPRDAFDRFWSRYPNKVGKADAFAKFDRARKRGRVTFAEIEAGLERYVAKTDDRPWCNPSTWLHQQRWADQPATVSRETRNGNGSGHRQGGFAANLHDLAFGDDRPEHEDSSDYEPRGPAR